MMPIPMPIAGNPEGGGKKRECGRVEKVSMEKQSYYINFID